MTLVVVLFLVAHGMLHLGIWLPHPTADADSGSAKPPPFEPDHSAVLTAARLSRPATRRVAEALAVLTAVAYLLAAAAVASDARVEAGAVAVAAVSGIVLKTLFFDRWLTLGLLIDVAILGAAVLGWPVPLP